MDIEEKDIVEWYDNWHKRNRHNSWRGPDAYEPLVTMLNARRGQWLLDLGCGTGFFLRAASNAGLETHGVDISSIAVALSKQASPTSKMYVRSMEDLSGLGQFDYITAFGSMEHCLDIGKALSSIKDALMPTGKFIVMVPNSEYDGPKMSVQDEIQETRKSMTEWQKLFESSGFIVDSTGEDMVMQRPDVPIHKTYQFVFTLSKGA